MSLKKLCQWRIFIMEFIRLPTFTCFTFIFFSISVWEISFLHVHNTKYSPNLSKPTECFRVQLLVLITGSVCLWECLANCLGLLFFPEKVEHLGLTQILELRATTAPCNSGHISSRPSPTWGDWACISALCLLTKPLTCCSASFSKSLLLKLFPAAWSNNSWCQGESEQVPSSVVKAHHQDAQHQLPHSAVMVG